MSGRWVSNWLKKNSSTTTLHYEDYSHRRYSSILKPVNIKSMWMLINICWDQPGGVIDVKKWWQSTLERDSDKQLCDSALVLNQIQPSLINRANERASQIHGPPHQSGFLFHGFKYGENVSWFSKRFLANFATDKIFESCWKVCPGINPPKLTWNISPLLMMERLINLSQKATFSTIVLITKTVFGFLHTTFGLIYSLRHAGPYFWELVHWPVSALYRRLPDVLMLLPRAMMKSLMYKGMVFPSPAMMWLHPKRVSALLNDSSLIVKEQFGSRDIVIMSWRT